MASDPGDIIGWSSLVENDTYTASAECLVPVKVLRIEKQRLDEILREDPASGMIFFKNLAALDGPPAGQELPRNALRTRRTGAEARGVRLQ